MIRALSKVYDRAIRWAEERLAAMQCDSFSPKLMPMRIGIQAKPRRPLSDASLPSLARIALPLHGV